MPLDQFRVNENMCFVYSVRTILVILFVSIIHTAVELCRYILNTYPDVHTFI